MRETMPWACKSVFAAWTLVLLFSVNAFALEGLEGTEFLASQTQIQTPLYDLAQNGGEKKACHQESSLELCASCCRAARDTCVSLAIPMCHQDDPNRSEFRHCTKDRERRCQTDFDNCAWLCRRAK